MPTKRIGLKIILVLQVVCLSLMMPFFSGAALADDEKMVGPKITPVDRVETPADGQFRKAMHMTYIGDATSAYASGANLYHAFTVTGEIVGEQQVYAVRDIEELASMSMENQAMHALALTASGMYTVSGEVYKTTGDLHLAGLDLVKFLSLCGVPPNSTENIYLQFYSAGGTKPEATLAWKELQDGNKSATGSPALLAFGLYDDKPLVKDAASTGYCGSCNNTGGPLRVVIPRQGEAALCIDDVSKILIGKTADADDPRYDLHNRAPYDSLGKTLTVNVYDSAAGKGAAPLKTESFTTAQLEQLALDHPEHVIGNYYGLIGNRSSMKSMGLGAWLDYYEGIDLWWLLEDRVGLSSVNGHAVFYGRDGLQYTTIDDLGYLNNRSGDYRNYTITTQEAVDVPDAVPMIAFSKNGYPILPIHDDENICPGHQAYNKLNQALMAAGIPCEVGVIKNDKGPFNACLGNVDNLYGGYQVETAGDCIRIDLFLNLPENFADVQGCWAKDAIHFVLAQDLFRGESDHAFGVDSAMTRGMLATVLGRLAGAGHYPAAAAFADVPAAAYYAPYVAWATGLGITEGVGNGRFAPDQAVSRQELAVILSNFARKRGLCSATAVAAVAFADQQDIAAWAKSGVQDANNCGLMSGYDDHCFRPSQYVSRSEVADVLMRFVSLEKSGPVQ